MSNPPQNNDVPCWSCKHSVEIGGAFSCTYDYDSLADDLQTCDDYVLRADLAQLKHDDRQERLFEI